MKDRDALFIIAVAAAVVVVLWRIEGRIDRLEYGLKRVLTDLHRRV